MTHDRFADPATPSGGVDFNEIQGSLLMIEVVSLEPHIPNVNTPPGEKSPAIRANVTILDGPKAGVIHDDTLLFPKVLQSQLRSRIGKLVLGRLVKGEPLKAGQTPPWKLEAATEADRRIAEGALSRTAVAPGGPASGQAGRVSEEPPF
jgi:hypothetical protein